ncbi:cold shock domain-containing protein [Streptomyces sp. JH34]|uniref:cold-shock protein n=1 Tax=unclassified Streptomyces TaxID=2593676 RepID=UPI0023F978A8|nr:cold shock domain-containing protein [Streptomyces sp. JH34]MDF6017879.1 cold shock domain-containing protein [Streptomyces sp. JH34]
MAEGTVQVFSAEKGYGYIRPSAGGPEIIVHFSAIIEACPVGLTAGQTVSFDVVQRRRGPEAERVKVAARLSADRGGR